MRKLIIIVLVLLFVVGGGAAGLVMLGVVRNPLKPPTPEMDAVAKAAAEADAKAKANAFVAPVVALTMVKAGDLVIPVLNSAGAQRKVFVTARLVIAPEAKAQITDEVPKIVSAMLSDLIPYFQEYFKDHDKIDLKVIKRKFKKHAKALYGDKVRDVLIVTVFESGGDYVRKGEPYEEK